METSSHLFLHCNLFDSVWNHIYRWVDVYAVMPSNLADHFIQFSHVGGAAKSRQSILQVIWFATTWELWKERNTIIFNTIESSISQVVDKIKAITFRWLKVKLVTLPFNYYGWWLSSFTILGIG